MLPRHHPGRVQITFDGHRLAANAGLILPATLALRLGLSQLLGKRLGLGDAPGRANTGGKLMTLAASALAGGDCTGGTARVPGFTAKAPSTPGAFLRRFRRGHVRQPDRVSRELPARARAAGDGPGGAPFTIGLDSAVCETCGLAKEGARHHGCTGARGYHPLPAIRRRNRRRAAVPAAQGPGQHRPRHRPLSAGDGGPGALRLGQRATHGAGRQRLPYPRRGRRLPPDGCPLLHPHRPARQPAEPDRGDTRGGPDAGSLPDGRRAAVAETACTPFRSEPGAAPVRLTVRRVKPTPGSQLALFAKYSYHAFITDRDGETLELEGNWRPAAAATPGSRTPSGTSSTA